MINSIDSGSSTRFEYLHFKKYHSPGSSRFIIVIVIIAGFRVNTQASRPEFEHAEWYRTQISHDYD